MLHELLVPIAAAGERLDVFLEKHIEGCTRSLIGRLIRDGRCRMTPGQVKAGYFLRGGEQVAIEVPEIEPMEVVPENIPLSVLHEDADLLVVDKPAGMVVHPAIGHARGTLVNALLGRYGDRPLGEVWRPGIVHRLDANTSGLIVVARTPQALVFLQEAFKEREVLKRYLVLVAGKPKADFLECTLWIGRHHADFRKRAGYPPETDGTKEAYTSFVVLERHDGYAVLEARPKTGRTHQIRVHCAAMGHPVLADPTYGRADHWPLNAAASDPTALRRHGLHAWTLDIPHPQGGRLQLQAPIPKDLAPWITTPVTPRPR